MNRLLQCGFLLIGFSVFGCSSGADPEEMTNTQEDALARPLVCAGPHGVTCPGGSFCSAPVGKCPSKAQAGTCATRPQFCPQIYKPVCGCDDHTYSNSCTASAAGVSIKSEGACPVPTGQFCGGIAGIPCPGMGHCVDDPSDDCDPAKGGADCGGICSCIQNVLCIKGTHFDASPSVCSCVPDSDPCATVRCAAGTHCVADGQSAKCEPDAVHCGGIAAIRCPGLGRCADDPNDNCDPAKGGADCGGICSCIENVLCIAGTHFDASPSVCDCVPDAALQ